MGPASRFTGKRVAFAAMLLAICPALSRSRRPRWATLSSRARRSAGPATPRPAAPSAAAPRSRPFRTTPPIRRRPAPSAARGWDRRPPREPVPARAAPRRSVVLGVQFSTDQSQSKAGFRHRTDQSPAHARWRDHRRPADHRRQHRRHLQRLRRPERHHTGPVRGGDLPPVPHAGDRHLRQGADRHADASSPGCTDGQFLTRVTADPCPACIDYLAADFRCGTNSYTMHVFTLDKGSGGLHGPRLAELPPAASTRRSRRPRAPPDRRLLLLPDQLQTRAVPDPTAPSARGSTTPARARATTAPTPSRCRPR